MNKHELQVGAISLTILDDVSSPAIMSADVYVKYLHELVPEHTVREATEKLFPDLSRFMKFSFNCLLIETGGKRLLVDTGSGMEAFPDYGQVQNLFSSEAVDPTSIDAVVISHCHGDHIIGLSNADGSAVFPNAELIMTDVEWEHWMGEDGVASQDEERAQTLNQAFEPYKDRLNLIELKDGIELARGVTTVAAEGHTPGHFGLLFESEGERLLDVVDLLHIGVQMPHPDWSLGFDDDKPLAAETRRKILSRCADEKLLTLIYHFEFPGLGYVRREGEGFRWEPVT